MQALGAPVTSLYQISCGNVTFLADGHVRVVFPKSGRASLRVGSKPSSETEGARLQLLRSTFPFSETFLV